MSNTYGGLSSSWFYTRCLTSTFTAPQATHPKAERQLTDSEIYERAQKQVLPKYIQGSL